MIRVVFSQLSGDVRLGALIGALAALLSYSSLAVVLLTAALSAAQVIPIAFALAIVVGANLGSGMLALQTTLRGEPAARRVTLGNLLFRATCTLIALPLLPFAGE